MIDYEKVLKDLLNTLAIEYRMIQGMWMEAGQQGKKADILNGQAMAIDKIIDLIKRKLDD